MITYQDLERLGQEADARGRFILDAIDEYKGSAFFRAAAAAQAYYDGENPTITSYEKVIFDAEGKAHKDMWTANHKIASSFFGMVVDQEVSYLLGNGIRFSDEHTLERLGDDFELEVQDALEYARIAGAAYGFWNLDRLVVFRALEFLPLYDEETGALKAGIRFWQLAPEKPLRLTLYEPDGYTEYVRPAGEALTVLREKRAYKLNVRRSEADGEEIVDGENYAGLPIVPLYANKQRKSALTGRRNTIDALDLSRSNMVNNVDEGNLIYWVLTNCGGMDDLDDARFVERLKTLHVSHADGDAGATATAQSIEAPFEGTKVTVDMLINQLYDDFQAFNAAAVTAANQSATAIQASYIPLDLKTDQIERQVTRFIGGILRLAGIDDEPTYERNQLINRQEETQNLIMQAQYLDEEYIRKKLLTINGDIDQYDEMVERLEEEEGRRMKAPEEPEEEEAE